MSGISVSDAIKHAYHLHDEWIGPRKFGETGFDFPRIRKSMLQELRFAKTKPGREGVVREIKGELVLLGKIQKVLSSSSSQNPTSLLPSTWKPCSVRRLPNGRVQVKIAGGRQGNPLGIIDRQNAFDAGKYWRVSGAYHESGVANARVVAYGFSKWLNELPPYVLRYSGVTKARLLKAFREGYAAGKRIEAKR